MQEHWDWGIFFQAAPFGEGTYGGWIIDGLIVTVLLFACAWIIAFLVGSLFGILRTVPNRFLAGLGTAYVAIFRNIPLIVQFFFCFMIHLQFHSKTISNDIFGVNVSRRINS